MAKYYPKAGYKGRVLIGSTVIAGSATWSYSGSERTMIPTDEFNDEIVTEIPGQITGGTITITGNYLMSQDAGQQLLKTRFDNGTAITDLKLYISETDSIYLQPDSGTTPASYVTVTNYDAITHDKSGIGTFTCTMKVSGKLLPTY
jgi:hypothetical protein